MHEELRRRLEVCQENVRKITVSMVDREEADRIESLVMVRCKMQFTGERMQAQKKAAQSNATKEDASADSRQ